jgi:hypothetical protein
MLPRDAPRHLRDDADADVISLLFFADARRHAVAAAADDADMQADILLPIFRRYFCRFSLLPFASSAIAAIISFFIRRRYAAISPCRFISSLTCCYCRHADTPDATIFRRHFIFFVISPFLDADAS